MLSILPNKIMQQARIYLEKAALRAPAGQCIDFPKIMFFRMHEVV